MPKMKAAIFVQPEYAGRIDLKSMNQRGGVLKVAITP